ncbi:MAG: NADH-quinone oxidoreductase subunit N [Acidobacteriota bacterium]
MNDLIVIAPQLHLLAWGAALFLVTRFLPGYRGRGVSGVGILFAVLGLSAALVHLLFLWNDQYQAGLQGTINLDSFSLFFSAVSLLSALLLLSWMQKQRAREDDYLLILLATAGMLTAAGAVDLISMFVALELISIPLYFLYSDPPSRRRLATGALSSMLVLAGFLLIYAATGTTNLEAVAGASGSGAVMSIALHLALGGLWVKVAGSLTPARFLASAGFLVLLVRFLSGSLADLRDIYISGLALLVVISMCWGSIVSLREEDPRRLLLYSSLSQIGFVLLAVAVGTDYGLAAGLFYLPVLLLSTLGLWAILTLWMPRSIGLCVPALIFVASLAGVPPLGGFMAKYLLFAAIVDTILRIGEAHLYWMLFLLVVGALNVLVSLYYYFRLARWILRRRPLDGAVTEKLDSKETPVIVPALAAAVIVLIGIYPPPILESARSAVLPLG